MRDGRGSCQAWAGSPERRGGQGGHPRRRSGGGERQRARDDAAGEFDLVGVVARGPRVGERGGGGAGEERPRPGGLADQERLGLARAPGLRGDAAERQARLGDPAALQPQGGGGRDQREGEGGALAQLEIAGVGAGRRPPRQAGGGR